MFKTVIPIIKIKKKIFSSSESDNSTNSSLDPSSKIIPFYDTLQREKRLNMKFFDSEKYKNKQQSCYVEDVTAKKLYKFQEKTNVVRDSIFDLKKRSLNGKNVIDWYKMLPLVKVSHTYFKENLDCPSTTEGHLKPIIVTNVSRQADQVLIVGFMTRQPRWEEEIKVFNIETYMKDVSNFKAGQKVYKYSNSGNSVTPEELKIERVTKTEIFLSDGQFYNKEAHYSNAFYLYNKVSENNFSKLTKDVFIMGISDTDSLWKSLHFVMPSANDITSHYKDELFNLCDAKKVLHKYGYDDDKVWDINYLRTVIEDNTRIYKEVVKSGETYSFPKHSKLIEDYDLSKFETLSLQYEKSVYGFIQALKVDKSLKKLSKTSKTSDDGDLQISILYANEIKQSQIDTEVNKKINEEIMYLEEILTIKENKVPEKSFLQQFMIPKPVVYMKENIREVDKDLRTNSVLEGDNDWENFEEEYVQLDLGEGVGQIGTKSNSELIETITQNVVALKTALPTSAINFIAHLYPNASKLIEYGLEKKSNEKRENNENLKLELEIGQLTLVAAFLVLHSRQVFIKDPNFKSDNGNKESFVYFYSTRIKNSKQYKTPKIENKISRIIIFKIGIIEKLYPFYHQSDFFKPLQPSYVTNLTTQWSSYRPLVKPSAPQGDDQTQIEKYLNKIQEVIKNQNKAIIKQTINKDINYFNFDIDTPVNPTLHSKLTQTLFVVNEPSIEQTTKPINWNQINVKEVKHKDAKDENAVVYLNYIQELFTDNSDKNWITFSTNITSWFDSILQKVKYPNSEKLRKKIFVNELSVKDISLYENFLLYKVHRIAQIYNIITNYPNLTMFSNIKSRLTTSLNIEKNSKIKFVLNSFLVIVLYGLYHDGFHIPDSFDKDVLHKSYSNAKLLVEKGQVVRELLKDLETELNNDSYNEDVIKNKIRLIADNDRKGKFEKTNKLSSDDRAMLKELEGIVVDNEQVYDNFTNGKEVISTDETTGEAAQEEVIHFAASGEEDAGEDEED
jgi:hypothetical protein